MLYLCRNMQDMHVIFPALPAHIPSCQGMASQCKLHTQVFHHDRFSCSLSLRVCTQHKHKRKLVNLAALLLGQSLRILTEVV